MSDELSAERIEALRDRLGLPAPPAEGGTAPPAALGGRARLKALVWRTARPVAVPVARRVLDLLVPAVSERTAERLLGRLDPEVRRLSAEVAVLRAEVEELRRAADDAARP